MGFWHRHFHDSLLIAHPVGHGNALELQSWGTALMDCGGDHRALQVLHSASARGMSEFLLTHLHADHYSGITNQPADINLSFDVDHVFLPALPLIGDPGLTKDVALALFTMNALLGDKSGIPEQDLIDSFESLNPLGSTPSHTLLSKGDLFDLAGTPFQVLWPPRAVSGFVARAAQKAVEEFNNAIEHDERAKGIRDRLENQAIQAARRATEHAGDNVDIVDDEAQHDDAIFVEEDSDRQRDVPEKLRSANRAIRGVANRLSLAFRCGSRLIHLGDLEKAELNQVVKDLGGATHFFGMIAAHHGTHFAPLMNNLCVSNLVVCNGKRYPTINEGYREIAHHIQETNVHGHSFLVF